MARGAGPGRLEVDAARRSLQDSPGSLRSCDYSVFLRGKVLARRAYQRDGLPSCFSRGRFIMLGVQEGREGRQTVKSRDVRKALNGNKCKHFYYPTR